MKRAFIQPEPDRDALFSRMEEIMNEAVGGLRVVRAEGEFYPRSFRWEDRLLRVLYVEGVRTSGSERRYRVRTGEGTYELGLNTATGAWSMRRAPSIFGRAWARMQHLPRYPLSVYRQRSRPVFPRPALRAVANGRIVNRYFAG